MAIKFSEMEEKATALDYEDLACVSEFDAMNDTYTTKKIKISIFWLEGHHVKVLVLLEKGIKMIQEMLYLWNM